MLLSGLLYLQFPRKNNSKYLVLRSPRPCTSLDQDATMHRHANVDFIFTHLKIMDISYQKVFAIGMSEPTHMCVFASKISSTQRPVVGGTKKQK